MRIKCASCGKRRQQAPGTGLLYCSACYHRIVDPLLRIPSMLLRATGLGVFNPPGEL